MSLNKIAITRILNEDVKTAVYKALDLIDAQNLFMKPNLKILIKPNLIIPKKPERGVTTHPAVVGSIIQWIKQFNPYKIIIADSSGTHTRGLTEKAFAVSGIKKVCEKYNVEWVSFEKTLRKTYKVKNPLVLKSISASILLEDVNLIINVPKIKTHSQCLLTCSIKNMFGTIILGNKAKIHAQFPNNEHFNSALADIYSVSCPQLTIIDGYYCQEGNGPTAGEVVKMDIILAGYDPVALDATVCRIVGFNPREVIYLTKAELKGIGNADLDRIEFLGDSIDSVKKKFKRPKNYLISISLLKSFFNYVFNIVFPSTINFNPETCKLCGICWKNCPAQAINPHQIKGNKFPPKLDKNRCIRCYCCVEFCPNEAVDFKINYKRILFKYLTILFLFTMISGLIGILLLVIL